MNNQKNPTYLDQTEFDPSEHPHRRRNPLTDEWVLVSPQRMKRPWQGQVEKLPPENRPAYDPTCYLCPGNPRAGGKINADYKKTFVFDNDFAVLLPDAPPVPATDSPFFQAQTETGICRVLCFSPRHDLTMPEMEPSAIRHIVDLWAEQVEELGARPEIKYVQILENKGSIMGCSNPHPHGQIWGIGRVPDEPAKEDLHQLAYYQKHGSALLLDYAKQEEVLAERIVVANQEWVAVVPYWAVWPFETLLLPRRHITQMPDLTDVERDALAEILKRLLTRYDNLFETSFPYSMGWHGQPSDGADHPHWQLHAHFYPPLLRSATVKKFMVGYEMLGTRQRDLTAEQAAKRLRDLPDLHYRSVETVGA